MIRSSRRVVVALGLCALLACGGPAIDDETIATIDDDTILLSEFRLYLRMNLLDVELPEETDPVSSAGEADGEADFDAELDDAEVRSRLLDAFIDERLLLAEATRREIEIEELEVAAYLAPSLEDTDAPPLLPESRRVAARHRLKVDRLREAIVRELPPPVPGQVRAYLEQHRERLIPKRRFVLRPLLFESLDEAKRIYREIRRGRMSFDEAVIHHAPANVRVATVEVSPEALPEELHAQLEKQRIGTTSPPFDMHGQVYVFRLEDRISVDPEAAETTAAALAREELERLRGKKAINELVEELRLRSRIQIVEAGLPFEYRAPHRE